MEIPAELAERYELLGELGEGAFGRVVHARDRNLGRQVAIKLMRVRPDNRERLAERFDREARMAARVQHHGVVQVFDHGLAGEFHYLVSEFVGGGDLEAWIEREGGKLPREEALRVVRGLLHGLAAIHEQGVVHRDLKPANIFLRSDGRVAIGDFGLGRVQSMETLTRTGQLIGTPTYMAPEQLNGLEVGPSTDLYALGILFFVLLTGERPFPRGDFGSMAAAKHTGLPGLDTAELHPDDLAFVRALVEPEPEDRPASAAAALELLDGKPEETEEMARSQSVRALSSSSMVGPIPAGGRPRMFLLGLVGLVGLGWAVHRMRTPPEGGAPAPVSIGRDGAEPHRKRIVEVFRRVRDSEAVRSGLGLAQAEQDQEVLGTWLRARSAFARELLDADLASAVQGLGGAVPGPEALEALCELRLMELLLAGDWKEGVEALYPPGASPGLARALGRWMEVESEPAIAGRREAWGLEDDAIDQAALGAAGGTWAVLRSAADFPTFTVPGSEKVHVDRRLRVQNYDGIGFVDPLRDVGTSLQIMVRDTHKIERPAASQVILVDARDPGGEDLVIAFRGYSWKPGRFAVITLEGDHRVRFVGKLPPPPPEVKPGYDRMGSRLRVDRRVLPEGLKEIRFQAYGIQAVSSPDDNTGLEQVYQRLPGANPGGG